MVKTADGMSRQDRIRDAYRRAVGDHDHAPRSIEDYLSTKDFLPGIRAAVPDVTLEEVCAVRWEDESSFTVPVKSNWSMPPAASKCRPATPRIQTSSARSTRRGCRGLDRGAPGQPQLVADDVAQYLERTGHCPAYRRFVRF